MEEPRRR
uniref:Uncharacterized protein n=1 Tax=Oryza rufipogon TaxID=4529 RepID=A0A1Y8Z852_ORYRU